MSMDFPGRQERAWLRLPCCLSEHVMSVVDRADERIVVTPADHSPWVNLWPEYQDDEDRDHPEGVPVSGTEGELIWVHRAQARKMPVRFVEKREEEPQGWALEPLGPATQTQRRKFVRVPVVIHGRIHTQDSRPPVNVLVSNLSEGGAHVFVPEEWIKRPVDLFFLELPDVREGLRVGGYIRWLADAGEGRYKIGIYFEGTSATVADVIRSFVFGRLLEQRRRARGLE
jgi:hypothetical protein